MASVEKVPMLDEGYRKLGEDLQRLKEERPLIVDAIEELQDIRDYDDAKAKAQEFISLAELRRHVTGG